VKKFSFLLLCSFIMIFGLAGFANAIPYTDTKDLNVTLGEGPIAAYIWGDTFTYSHSTPSDFEVPYDIVNSATLTLSGYFIDDSNDAVEVNGLAVGELTEGGDYGFNLTWSGLEWEDNPSISSFDIASTFSSWDTGAPLQVSITANGDFPDGILELDSSTFSLEYENGTAPVPEPSTIMLMGVGLLGLMGYSRRRFHKNS